MIDWVGSIGRMLLAGENRITGDNKTCSSATLYTISPTETDLGSKPVLPGERPTISYQRHD